MSTKIEDLSDNEEEELYEDENEEFLEDLHQEDLHIKKSRKEKFTEDPEEESLNSRIMNMVMEKIKQPVVVTLIMLLLTHPLLIQGIFRIPYAEVADGTIGINVILAILGGILFFIFNEFLFST
jgi:membrane-bound ClpP family serine protease